MASLRNMNWVERQHFTDDIVRMATKFKNMGMTNEQISSIVINYINAHGDEKKEVDTHKEDPEVTLDPLNVFLKIFESGKF